MKQGESFSFIHLLACRGDQVGTGLVGVTVDNAIDRFQSGGGHLFRIGRDLDGWDPLLIFVPGHQFIDGPEGGLIISGDQTGSHPPGIHLSTLGISS